MAEATGAFAVFTVSLSGVPAADVTVDYATSPGTAAADSDYTTTSGTLTIVAPSTSGTISIPILNDSSQEVSETFSVDLSNASGAIPIADGHAVGTITDGDAAPTMTIAPRVH